MPLGSKYPVHRRQAEIPVPALVHFQLIHSISWNRVQSINTIKRSQNWLFCVKIWWIHQKSVSTIYQKAYLYLHWTNSEKRKKSAKLLIYWSTSYAMRTKIWCRSEWPLFLKAVVLLQKAVLLLASFLVWEFRYQPLSGAVLTSTCQWLLLLVLNSLHLQLSLGRFA